MSCKWLRPSEAVDVIWGESRNMGNDTYLKKMQRLELLGWISAIRTLGGHRRYCRDDVEAAKRKIWESA